MTAFQILMTYIGVWLYGYIIGKEVMDMDKTGIRKFDNLRSYVPYACQCILWADKLNIWDRKEIIIKELCKAYEDGKIDEFEGASAIHIINATYGLREAMFKNE